RPLTKYVTHRVHDAATRGRDLSHDGLRLEGQPPDDDRASRLDDARLFGGDRLVRVAEHLAMIERDRRDDRYLRQHDIRRIEPPAESDFDNTNITAATRELEERHRRHEFEETWMLIRIARADGFGDGLEFVDVGHDLGLAQDGPVNLDTFPEANEMG